MAISAKIAADMEKSSWIRKMFETGAVLKQQYGAENVYDFSLGNPNVPPPEAFFTAVAETAAENPEGIHGYMPNAGFPETRRAVAEYASKELTTILKPEHIILSCGAGGGMNVVLKTILNPGDEVVVSAPYFMEYNFYAGNHGGTVKAVPGKDNFDLDIGAIAAGISPKTAAVIINSPNNPSGAVYGESLVRELGNMLEKKSTETGRTIYLISDEPYRKIVYDGVSVPSVMEAYNSSIVVTSYSKDISIPGERIGYIAVHPNAEDCKNIVDGAILSTRILGFVNAPALMQRVIVRLQGEHIDPDIYKRKRDLLCDGLAAGGYEFTPPKGTFYLMPKAPGGDDTAFVAALQQERILAVPGRGFGLPGYFRLSFCVKDETIIGSLPGFSRACNRMHEQ
jgi:aspartate aminotransferase